MLLLLLRRTGLDSGRRKAGVESSCPLPVGGSLLGLCNSPSIQTSSWGPSPSLGGMCCAFFSGVFPSRTPSSGSPPLPTSWAENCQPVPSLPFTGEETETTKGEVSSPGQAWACFMDTGLGGRGLCPLRTHWPPSFQHFSAINNPLRMPQIPGPGSPVGAPEVWGWEVGRQGSQPPSSPLPGK